MPALGTQRIKQKKTRDLDKILTNKEFDEILNIPRHNPNTETRTIAVSLSKGGVGKTTTAANLAHGLSIEGRKVLLVDTDRQAQCRLILGCNPMFGTSEFTNPKESERFELKDVVHLDENRKRLHFLSGSESLDGWEEIAGIVAQSDQLNPFRKFEFIKETIGKIADSYDYVIFDTPPGIHTIGYNVLFYAGELLIPAHLAGMTEDSIKKFLTTYEKICLMRERLNEKPLRLKYFLPTFKKNTLSTRNSYEGLQAAVEILRNRETNHEQLKDVKLLEPIPQNTKIEELPSFGQTIFEHSPMSAGAQAYGLAVEEILKDE